MYGGCESSHILRRTLAHLPTNPLDWANTGRGGSSTSGHWGTCSTVTLVLVPSLVLALVLVLVVAVALVTFTGARYKYWYFVFGNLW